MQQCGASWSGQAGGLRRWQAVIHGVWGVPQLPDLPQKCPEITPKIPTHCQASWPLQGYIPKSKRHTSSVPYVDRQIAIRPSRGEDKGTLSAVCPMTEGDRGDA